VIKKLGMVTNSSELKIEEAAETSAAGPIKEEAKGEALEEATEVVSTILIDNTLLRSKLKRPY
jgi:hypothetical protein